MVRRTDEEVIRALRVHETSTEPTSEVAKRVGVAVPTLVGWVKKTGLTFRRSTHTNSRNWEAIRAQL